MHEVTTKKEDLDESLELIGELGFEVIGMTGVKAIDPDTGSEVDGLRVTFKKMEG